MKLEQHAGVAYPSYTIYTLGDDDTCNVYVACVGNREDDPPDIIEERWNELARDMWRRGLEPVQDEPFFTHVEDGVICDHYALIETTYEAPMMPFGEEEYDTLV